MVMLLRIIDWINGILTIDESAGDDGDRALIRGEEEEEEELDHHHHLDGRWEQQQQEEGDNLYRFNCNYHIANTGDHAVLNSEFVALDSVIRALQYLNREQHVSTLTQPVSSSSSGGGGGGRGSSFLDNYGGSVSGMNQRQRRLRQLKFEYRMLKKRKRRALQKVQRKQYWRDDGEMLYDVEAELAAMGDSDDDDDDDDDDDEEDTLGQRGALHIMRDIDLLQQRYTEVMESAGDLEDQQRMFLQREQTHLDRELAVLDSCIQSYLYAPLLKDEQYRSINNELFQEFDDDPAHMVLGEIPVSDPITRRVRESYPKLRVLSKRTPEDRTRRRYLLLSSPFSTNETDVVIGQAASGGTSNNAEEWEIEAERISGLLGHFSQDQVTWRQNRDQP